MHTTLTRKAYHILLGVMVLALLIALLADSQIVLAATYTEGFEIDTYWNCNGSCTSYGIKSYADPAHPEVTFGAVASLRETAGTQDGYPKTRNGSAYAWRLNQSGSSSWQAIVTTGGVGTFSVYVRRWDGSPDPDYIVEYSIDNGTNWTTVQTINNAWLDNSSDYKQVTGIINASNGAGDADDIIIRIRWVSGERIMVDDFEMTDYVGGGDTPPYVTSTTPTNGAVDVALNADVTINFSEDVTTTGTWFDITCATSGNHAAAVSGGPMSYTLNPDVDFTRGELCNVTIYASQVADQDGTPDQMAENYVFSFTADNFGTCGDGSATLIHIIQGTSDVSPMNGATNVVMEGLVVGDFQGSAALGGFYLQEENFDVDNDPATSEGVFIYQGYSGTAVNVGDVVRVQGDVSEYYGLTEIKNIDKVVICPANGGSVAATNLTLPFPDATYPERYESMLLNLSQTLYVTEIYNLGRYGEVWLSSGGRLWQPTQITTPGASAIAQQAANDLNRILLDDGSNTEDPDPIVYPAPGLSFVNTLRGGDSVTGLTGVLSYGYGYYLVEPTAVPAFIHANPRPAAPPVLGGRVKVMTYNLLNYFNGDGQGGGFPTSRGASTAEEFERQRIKIINGIVAAGPDVIGLMELENDGFGPYSAIQDLVNGLNEAAPSGTTYSFIDAGGPIGTDEIVVGIIYRIETMAPIGSPAILDSSVDPRFLDTKNRPALAQTFDEIMTGERFTVVVNHLKSKGSDCNDVGDPDTGDGQGNCNLTRLAAAQALVDWTLTDPTGSGDHDFFLMGDMNSYAMEDPIKAFEAGGYVNLHNVFESPVPYSYAFDGQWGTLDHILASASLMRQITRAATWHINSDEPIVLDYNMEYKSPDQLSDLYGAEPFRSSDHDPIIVGLFASADFSDLPASYGSAWHTGNGAVRLGIGWDNNPDSSDGADDATDDGVLRRPGVWAPRQRVIIQVKASKVGYLAAWFDWNDNGVFEAKEKAISKTVSKGSQLVALVVGADFNPSLHPNLRCRFRLYPSLPGTGVSPTGAAKGGEVEDYTWTFTFLSNVLDVSHTTSILMPDITAWISQKQ